LLKLTSPN